MSIYRRKSGRYAVLVELDPTSSGLRKRKSIGTYRTKKEAEAAERRAIEARDNGTDLSPKTLTVSALIGRYLDRCRTASRATKTLERYESLARCHILPVVGGVTLARLQPGHVGEVCARAARDRSPRTVRHVHSLLYAALDWGVTQNLCARNIADISKGDLPKAKRSPALAFTHDEMSRILAVAEKTPWHPVFVLALCTGARRGELCGLRWSSVDLDRATVTIAESAVRTRAGLEFKDTKTGRVRNVPLNRLGVAALRAHRLRQNEERLRMGALYESTGLVFANEIGLPWDPQSISNAFARLARAAKLPSTRLHDVRHTFATWLLQSGVPLRTVSELLGHSDPATTLRIYAHVLPGADAGAVEAITERLGRAQARGA